MIDTIAKATDDEKLRQEVRQRLATEEAERRRQTQRLYELRKGYETWEAALVLAADSWVDHCRRSAFFEAIRAEVESPSANPEAAAALAWAIEHLDPLILDEPGGQPGPTPVWTHEQSSRGSTT